MLAELDLWVHSQQTLGSHMDSGSSQARSYIGFGHMVFDADTVVRDAVSLARASCSAHTVRLRPRSR